MCALVTGVQTCALPIWMLPWTAIHHRRAFPRTALIAGYRTDFPNAHIYRVAKDMFGSVPGKGFRWLSYGYAAITYRAFDRVYVLGEIGRASCRERGCKDVEIWVVGGALKKKKTK